MDDRLDRLPSTYAAFLRLERAGVPADVIAEQLEVAPESLPLLARLAHAKLAQVGSDPPGGRVGPVGA
jgi:hypothetical protein